MMVSLSKGLGAPIGSLMLGSTDAVAEARVWRKRLGGGWRQAGVVAAAGLYAVDHNIDRLADDHANARLLAEAAGVDHETVETNIVVIPTPDASGLVARCADQGVLVSAVGPSVVRLVTHLDVSAEDAHRAAWVLKRATQP
jgi:threonine aldolase